MPDHAPDPRYCELINLLINIIRPVSFDEGGSASDGGRGPERRKTIETNKKASTIFRKGGSAERV